MPLISSGACKSQILIAELSMNKNKGFTLIELLVSVLILGIGLMGLAGMQAYALRHSSDSYVKTQSIVLIDAFYNRLIMNQDGLDAGYYDNLQITKTSGLAAQTCGLDNPCNAQELANNDKYSIQQYFSDSSGLFPDQAVFKASSTAITGGHRILVSVIWPTPLDKIESDDMAPRCGDANLDDTINDDDRGYGCITMQRIM